MLLGGLTNGFMPNDSIWITITFDVGFNTPIAGRSIEIAFNVPAFASVTVAIVADATRHPFRRCTIFLASGRSGWWDHDEKLGMSLAAYICEKSVRLVKLTHFQNDKFPGQCDCPSRSVSPCLFNVIFAEQGTPTCNEEETPHDVQR